MLHSYGKMFLGELIVLVLLLWQFIDVQEKIAFERRKNRIFANFAEIIH